MQRIMVMPIKGTPPGDPSTPAAFAHCVCCGKELVYDARETDRMVAEHWLPHCPTCAVDVIMDDEKTETVH
jgi:hypothetical protein